MQALQDRHPPAAQAAMTTVSRSVADRTSDLLKEMIVFLPPARVVDTVAGWLARIDTVSLPANREVLMMADALALAGTLALFTPSGGGTVPADRLARARRCMEPGDAAAIAALRRTQFRLSVVLGAGEGAAMRLRDVISGEEALVHGSDIEASHAGLHVAAWLAPLPCGGFAVVGAVTPLDEAGVAVAMGFFRPGRVGLVNPVRCAEAVYRHVVRHGTIRVPELNGLPFDEDSVCDEPHELDRLAAEWARPGAERDPEDVQFARAETSETMIIDLLGSAANTRAHGHGALSDAYAAIALLQMETVQRRASVGSGSLRLPRVAAALDAAIAAGQAPAAARAIFDGLRQRLGAASAAGPGARAPDAELDKLIGRIQALRAKTVEQGCTEQEALSAAEKVAELLDRYGLSLSELDMKQQSCEGLAVETTRKRASPLDDCVPAAAAFFDCRVWQEKSPGGTLRYVFFGLPADVAAAQYLYDLVDQAFTRETALFQAGDTYAAMPSRLRRTGTNSFQIGLARGIAAKLAGLRADRETSLRRSSGRDLVTMKASLVEAELSALGLSLRARTRSGGRRVLSEAFKEGHSAGLGFSYTPGIRDAA